MAYSELLSELERLGCTVTHVPGAAGHVLVRREGWKSIVPLRGPEEPQLEADTPSRLAALSYPVMLTEDDDGTIAASLPDFPGATSGRTRAEVLERVRHFLADASIIYAAMGWPLPEPARRHAVYVSVRPRARRARRVPAA